MSKVSEALRSARKSADISQRELAKTLGFSAQFLNDIELGRRSLPRDHYAKLPVEICAPVITAAITDHYAAITELTLLLNKLRRDA